MGAKITHGRARKKKEESGLIITSLIDVFTILLIFLLQNFSAEGSLCSNAENLTLPNSNSKKRPQETSIQISVTSDMLVLDNKPCIPTSDIAAMSQTAADPIIKKLYDKLTGYYAQELEMVKVGYSNKVEGRIVVQIDKNIPFDVMYKVMYTCGRVGYNNMNFAVIQRDGVE